MAESRSAELRNSVDPSESKALWVFGYGSLCWMPGFEFDKAVIGHIQGYSRKFWQGNTAHRGTEEKPGRVATLIDDDKGTVFGVAFAVSGENAIPYLTNRECTLGGYITTFSTFYPIFGEPIKVLVYIATPKNNLWLGDSPILDIANQVFECRGNTGHNVEYVVRLANFMRHHFPGEDDSHLFTLEAEVLSRIKAADMNLDSYMGDGRACVTFSKAVGSPSAQRRERDNERVDTFQYTARVPQKTLRCLNK